MAKLLPIPAELQHLIEKREQSDRRGRERRASGRRRTADLGPLGSIESAKSLDDVSLEERRATPERRKSSRRGATARRRSDGSGKSRKGKS